MRGGRESKGLGGGGPPTDLLVCFPSRAHLALMPKPICSPVRPKSEPSKRHLKKINTRSRSSAAVAGGQASPLMWAKGKQAPGGPDISEPTSPKVTCAGQIKVRPRSSSGTSTAPTTTTTCRNWQSVMEEIERLHTSRSKHWAEALGFKKDVANFLTCLGNLRFDFRCFGSFPETDVTSDDEEEEEEEEEEDHYHYYRAESSTEEKAKAKGDQGNTVFSKWFMVLQENQPMSNSDHNTNYRDVGIKQTYDEKSGSEAQVQVPPPNALLLMRCRSAPAKRSNCLQKRDRLMDEDERNSRDQVTEEVGEREQESMENNTSREKTKKKKRETLAVIMKYDPDFHNLSPDVSQEDTNFSRSKSWKK